MPYLIHKTGNRKPSFPSRIDWKHSLSNKLMLACACNEAQGYPANSVTGRFGRNDVYEPAGDHYFNGGLAHLIGTAYGGVSRYDIPPDNDADAGGKAFTIAIKYKNTSTLSTGTPATFIGCVRNATWGHGIIRTTTNEFQLSAFPISASPVAETLNSTTVAVIDVMYAIVGTYRIGGKKRIWVNGVLENEADTSNSSIWIPDTQIGFGNSAAGYYQVNNTAWEYVLYWNRELQPQEVQEFYKNPYAMFESKARYYVSTAPTTAIKTILGLAKASVKTVDGLAIASVKTWEGLT